MMRSTLAMAAACLVLAACGGGGGGGGGLPELKPRPPGPSFDPAAGQRDAQRRALGLALDSANARTAGLDADSGDDEMEKAAAALTGLAARIAEAHSLPASEIATARRQLATYGGRRDDAEIARVQADLDALGPTSADEEFAAALAAIEALATRIEGGEQYLTAARRAALRAAIATLRTGHTAAIEARAAAEAAAGPEAARAAASTRTGRLGPGATDNEFAAALAAIDAFEAVLIENGDQLTDERAAAFRAALASLRTAYDTALEARSDADTAAERRRRTAQVATAVASGVAAGLPVGTAEGDAAPDPLAETDSRSRFESAREAVGQLEAAILAAAGVLDQTAIDAARATLRAFQDHLAEADHSRIRDSLLAGLAADRHSAVGLVQGVADLSITFAGERLTVEESGTRRPRFGLWHVLDYRRTLNGEDNHAVVYSNLFPTGLLDQSYLRFGWWSRDDGTEIDVIPFYAPAGRARLTDREIWDRERGTDGRPKTSFDALTYQGAAAGKVAVRDTGTPANDLAGAFTANVELMIAADHEISGSITGFVVTDAKRGAVEPTWTVTLPATPLHGQPAVPGDATFGSPSARPTWTGGVFGGSPTDSSNAYWAGGIYEPDPAPRRTIEVTETDAEDNETTVQLPLPTDRGNVAVGVFSTGVAEGTATGRMTGAFGATR